MSKILKCSECGKKTEVGNNTISVICGDCTMIRHEKWLKEQIDKQNEFEKEKIKNNNNKK
jgi:endogenous inhibitor of DNA gyrase (YacG/DUF329 family)